VAAIGEISWPQTGRFQWPLTPAAWRREPVHEALLRASEPYWPVFERWCEERNLRAFPASVETVRRFLVEPPVTGRELYATWKAIDARHEAYYWNSNANPVTILRFGHGWDVTEEGSVEVGPPPRP